MSDTVKASQIASKLVADLKRLTNESKIREVCIKHWSEMENAVSKGNLTRCRTLIRASITDAFPTIVISENPGKPKPKNYYWTNNQQGKIERYEHLALWYFTTAKKQWKIVGDDARKEYWDASEVKAEEKPESYIEPATAEILTTTVEPQQLTLDSMKIEALQLDGETEQMVEDAIAHSGITLADFVRRACQVYAKTITGKVKQSSEDLTAVPTELLLSDTYKTHPGRADELAKRAIYALEMHNNNCTEKAQKWHINQTAIQSLTGSKPATIKEILLSLQTRLNDHNTKHDLNPYDNRKGNGRKIDLEIDLAALVPDGLNLN